MKKCERCPYCKRSLSAFSYWVSCTYCHEVLNKEVTLKEKLDLLKELKMSKTDMSSYGTMENLESKIMWSPAKKIADIKTGISIKSHDDWKTPPYIYDPLDLEFDFNFDPCPHNHDLNLWDGLEIDWKERSFINPPYNKKDKSVFIRKAIEESKKGKLCVMLIPVVTSSKIFHEEILPNATEIRYVKGRIKFLELIDGELVKPKSGGRHDSMIVIFDGRK